MPGPLDNLLALCDRLGIAAQGSRKAVLTASTKALSHESVLFFLCARDYVHNATDLKLTGIQTLFLGQGTPYEINISAGARATATLTLNGVRPGGVANYNLGTKALSEMYAGFGAAFLNDMVNGVQRVKSGAANAQANPQAVMRMEQEMRNHARRFWMADLGQIGL